MVKNLVEIIVLQVVYTFLMKMVRNWLEIGWKCFWNWLEIGWNFLLELVGNYRIINGNYYKLSDCESYIYFFDFLELLERRTFENVSNLTLQLQLKKNKN